MSAEIRTVAAFHSDRFNLSEEKDYFFNPGCFGDDLALWLIVELRAAGRRTDDEPGQEDFGWYVNFDADGERYCAVIGNEGGEGWFIVVERARGFLASVLGGRNRGVGRGGVEAIHRILASSPDIRDLRWFSHERFRRGGGFDADGWPEPVR